MRMLQSLLDRYESVYGPMLEFNLDSLLKDKVTTRSVDISELVKLHSKTQKFILKILVPQKKFKIL